jgi:uncharacterized protein
LLARISGLSTSLAEAVVRHRDENGAFTSREGLKKVPRLGAKTFEQAAGFLRINGGENPLDTSSVHPEAYPVVERILADLGQPLAALTGDTRAFKQVDAKKYTDERFGLPTVQDILRELEKPGRDPRPEFKTASFQDGVEDLKDLTAGMLLEGVVTNVTNFGAFVDIGVHQDGLVHISMMSHKFIKDPRELVKAGDVVKVKVLEVDLQRKRVALTMKLDETRAGQPPARDRPDSAPAGSRGGPTQRGRDSQHRGREQDRRPSDSRGPNGRPAKPRESESNTNGAMAEALARAFKR